MQNIAVIVGSPANKVGNSESIADCFIDKLNSKKQDCSKILLRNEIKRQEDLIERMITTDKIILSFPVYENSVPGLVLEFFELLYQYKDKFTNKQRKMLVISNSGYAEPQENQCAIECCHLFADKMEFYWMGGFYVSPGTLINGKRLEEAGNTYKKIVKLISLLSEKIANEEDIPENTFLLASKPLISPFIYRLAGKMMQNRAAKKMGKEKYYAKPFN